MPRQKPKRIIVKKLSKGKGVLLPKTQPWATKKCGRESLRKQERRGK